jgi:hypothetical protein
MASSLSLSATRTTTPRPTLRFVVPALALAALAGSAAAAPYHWLGGDSVWSDHVAWFGPAGLVPSTVNDTATIHGNVDVDLDMNLALGALTIANSADVFSSGHSVFVSGATVVSGGTASMSVSDSPALRDFDTDVLTLTHGGRIYNYDGVMQIDESATIGDMSGIIGVGVIEMNSTTGDLDLGEGVIWADEGASQTNRTLTVRRTPSSTSRLDWTDPDSNLLAWSESTLVNELPYAGPFGGRLTLYSDAEFESADGFLTTGTSQIHMSSYGAGDPTATLSAPWMDHAGELSIIGQARVDVPLVALRGEVNITADNVDAHLRITSGFTQLNSVGINGTGANIVVAPAGSELSVTGGLTTVNLPGANTEFDLSGTSGMMDVSVTDGAALDITARRVASADDEYVNGDWDIEGDVIIRDLGQPNPWTYTGEMTLDHGSVAGREFDNTGTIRGRGEFLGRVNSTGVIDAQDGALYFRGWLDMRATGGPAIVRAVNGDISIDSAGFDDIYAGTLEVGNGVGIKEVFESDAALTMTEASVLNLNSALLRAKSVVFAGEMNAAGASEIRASGNSPFTRIVVSGDATISGHLLLNGPVELRDSATFAGEGTISAVGAQNHIELFDAVDLADVALVVTNRLELTEAFDEDAGAQATVRDLTLAPTAKYHADLGGPHPGDGDTVHANDSAFLAGELVLAPATGFAPAVPSTYTVVSAGTISGTFDAVEFSALGANRRAHVEYTPSEVRVTVTCLADLAEPFGQLSFGDVAAFLDAFNAQDPAADIALPFGQFTFADISAFTAAFDAGCS